MKKNFKNKQGQTMTEYIIIVLVIAIAALTLFGIFGDTIRKKLTGAVSVLDEDKGSEAQSEYQDNEAASILKNIDEEGSY
jgi:Flp pilus assembly pilin Flp